MTRWACLLLPVLGIVAADTDLPDLHAVKSLALLAGAIACVAFSLERRRVAWSAVSAALWIFLGARAFMLTVGPASGRAWRWWSLLLALTLAHHAACAAAPRRWLRRRAPDVLGGLAAAIGIVAVGQWAAGASQAAAFFAHRNFAAFGLAMLLPYALASRWRWPFLAAALAGLVATQSRGGALAAAAAAGLWFAWHRWRWPVLVGLPAAVLAGGLLLGNLDTVKVRCHWYEAAWTMGRAHPVTGVGADGFAREYPPVRPLEEYAIHGGRTVHSVHNDYLESFAEGGAIGLGAHLLLVGAAAWALRRRRTAAASLLAFAVASMVDLPLRDPSLLALAFFGLSFAGRQTFARPAWPFVAAGVVAILVFFPRHLRHWQAERALGRGDVEAALGREPDHPEALLARGTERDLEVLLEQRPHHAGALLNRVKYLPPDEMVPALRAILREHDPHDVLTRVRLAQLVARDDPLQATSLLEGAIEADPRAYRPHLFLARIHRESGNLGGAEGALGKAERAVGTPEGLKGEDPAHAARLVASERLAFEIEALRHGDRSPRRIFLAVRALPPAEVRVRVERALAAAERVKIDHPMPRVERKPGESIADHARRIEDEKEKVRATVRREAAIHLVEARHLAEALTAHHPTARHFRLLGQAVAGEADFRRATQMEALALLLETLEALRDGNEAAAATRLRRAVRAYPGLGTEDVVQEAVRAFARDHPGARPRARRIFADHPALMDALEPGR